MTSGIIGTLMAVWGIRFMLELYSEDPTLNAGWLQFGVDWRVATFALGVSLLTVALFGVWPARAGTRFELSNVLRSDADRSVVTGDPTRTAHIPIVLQLTLSLALFAGATLLALTYRNVTRIDLGYRPQGLFEVHFPTDRDTGSLAGSELYRRVRDPLQSSPGVAVSLSGRFDKFNGGTNDRGVYLPDGSTPVVPSSEETAAPTVISDDYFQVMGIRMVRGRQFGNNDGPGTMPVTIVSRAFASRAWGTANVVGRTLVIGKTIPGDARSGPKTGTASSIGTPTLVTVVGVADDRRRSVARDGAMAVVPRPEVYVSNRQAQFYSGAVMIRATFGQAAVSGLASRVLQSLGKQLPLGVISWAVQSERETHSTKTLAAIMSAFALVSLVLAMIGIYGIVGFGVEQRTRGIGIRVALGARPSDVIRTTMSSGARLTAVGLGLGVVVAAIMGKVLSGFVIGTTTTSIGTTLVVAALFGMVALAAAYLPARRAARLDPVAALRA